MEERRTDGIVLHSTPYRANDRIVRIFTKEAGLISIIVKRISPKRPELLSLSSPFSMAEIVYKKGKKDLHSLKEAHILDTFQEIRKKLSFIQAASHMARTILTSQMPGKRSKQLFLLFQTYLKKIAEFENPNILSMSFVLKLLRYDGFLVLKMNCEACDSKASFLLCGESLCERHAPTHAISFSDDEWETLLILAFAKKFSELKEVEITNSLEEKIETIFQVHKN